MKDEDTANTEWIEGAWQDFLSFLGEKDLKNAAAVLDSVGENGFENDALKMHKMINDAKPTPFDIVGGQMDTIIKGLKI